MSATIKDIARETGLALATISKYINGGTVRPQNKKQIDEAIRKLNYVPRNTARGLRSSKTYRIGLVSGPPNTPHNAFLLSKIENTMRAHGYSLTFMSGDKYKDHVNKLSTALASGSRKTCLLSPLMILNCPCCFLLS